ncbi:MAG: PSD1 and planctomycete cytochrome C domain-containing protein [Verrucomicrobiales bacterium]|nr:PSD1 and planctomycete cytochrome C domain-containing protein [Verrucomicrobiales bacterium]
MNRLSNAFIAIGVSLAVGASAAGESTIDFTSDIKPILQTHCTQCHADGKRKGGFSMDHIHALEAGGESGPVVVSGKSAESHLIDLVSSNDANERMPPKGDPLSDDEIAKLRSWIDQGLVWEKGFTFTTVRSAPIEPRIVALPPGEASNPVDRLLESYFQEQQVQAGSPVSDAVFARRVYLDTIGLLPTPDELEGFCLDADPNKRRRLVAELLADEDNYSAHWFTFWSDCLRNSMSRSYHGGGGKQITDWLKQSLAENKPYDQFVRELIDPVEKSSGFIKGIAWRGTVNASQVTEMQAAQNVAQVFMGLNIKCSSCHDSFINDWTLKQTYAFASIFADQPMDIHRCDKPLGEKAAPAFLYPELGAVDPAAPKAERVKRLAGIITSPENGRFARTMVNRLWAIFFGHGIVEPVDEMDNPPWNKDLLDWLAVDLVQHGYDLKHTMMLMLTSQAYQCTAVPLDPDGDSDAFVFRGPVVRRLSAEQFLDGIDQVIACATREEGAARGTGKKRWGLRKIDPLIRTLGRTKRDVIVTQRESVATTAQLIELSNGKALADIIAKGAQSWYDSGKDFEAMMETLFVHALGRTPAVQEKETLREIVGTPIETEGIEDMLWMLVMHPEFQLVY